MKNSRSGGILLICCTIASLLLANSGIGDQYIALWEAQFGFDVGGIMLRHPLEFWINDGLMTVFFISVALEIKLELFIGELSTFKTALLPVVAALGGMLVPALIHLILNSGTPTASGFGIPMATDIAFALGALSLLGNKIPVALKIFLTAFAIIDDLGAILVIAIFYTDQFLYGYFILAIVIWLIIFLMNRLHVNSISAYVLPGFALWYCMLESGVHATISGVLFAFALPFGNGNAGGCSTRLQKILHKPVVFVILPLFALANTAIEFPVNWTTKLVSRNSLGILAGLVLGKPIGIVTFTLVAVKLKVCHIASNVRWGHIFGVALLGGMGFTMSIFITLLAYTNVDLDANSKIAILLASLIAGVLGCMFLKLYHTPLQQSAGYKV